MATGTRHVLDFSFSRINHATARGAGVVGCMRYLYNNGKGLTLAEVNQFRASGLALGLNYEAGAGDFIGLAAGRSQATSAAALARAIGLGGYPIAFSADFDVPSSKYGAVGDAVLGALQILGAGKVGIYGHAGLMAYIKARFGQDVYRWQTYAWSGGLKSPYADLYQFQNGQNFAGGQVDYNQIINRTFWAIGPNNSPGITNANVQGDDSMSAADVADLKKYIDQSMTNNVLNTVMPLLRKTANAAAPMQMFMVDTNIDPDGAIYAGSPGRWWHIPTPDWLTAMQNANIVGPDVYITDQNQFNNFRSFYLGLPLPGKEYAKDPTKFIDAPSVNYVPLPVAATVDASAIATELGLELSKNGVKTGLSDDDVSKVVAAVVARINGASLTVK